MLLALPMPQTELLHQGPEEEARKPHGKQPSIPSVTEHHSTIRLSAAVRGRALEAITNSHIAGGQCEENQGHHQVKRVHFSRPHSQTRLGESGDDPACRIGPSPAPVGLTPPRPLLRRLKRLAPLNAAGALPRPQHNEGTSKDASSPRPSPSRKGQDVGSGVTVLCASLNRRSGDNHRVPGKDTLSPAGL